MVDFDFDSRRALDPESQDVGRHVQADIYAHQNSSNHYTTYNSHVEMDTEFSPGSAIPSALSSPKAIAAS